MERLRKYFFVCDGKRGRIGIARRIYGVLWLIGLLSAVCSYSSLEYSSTTQLQLDSVVFWLLGVASLIQQWAVYNDMHIIEEDPAVAELAYPNWLNARAERIIRFLIVLSLLFGVGEIAEIIVPLLNRFHLCQYRPSVCVFLHPEDAEKNLQHNLFVLGSMVVFGLLTVWNLFALGFRWNLDTSDRSPAAMAQRWIVNARVLLFAVVSFICFLYWLLVAGNVTWVRNVAQMLVISYLGCLTLALALRYNFSSQLVKKKLEKALSDVRS